MDYLQSEGVSTHFVELINETDSLVKKLDMAPVECVVNVAAGSICKRLGLEEGMNLNPPTFEFFYKDDDLGDPMINEYHIKAFGWATEDQVEQMQVKTFEVNTSLKRLFSDAGMILVDYKLEFGDYKGELLLGDEFTPDGCRVWDAETREKLDKDRFRQDLGDVVESYQIMAKRLGVIENYLKPSLMLESFSDPGQRSFCSISLSGLSETFRMSLRSLASGSTYRRPVRTFRPLRFLNILNSCNFISRIIFF